MSGIALCLGEQWVTIGCEIINDSNKGQYFTRLTTDTAERCTHNNVMTFIWSFIHESHDHSHIGSPTIFSLMTTWSSGALQDSQQPLSHRTDHAHGWLGWVGWSCGDLAFLSSMVSTWMWSWCVAGGWRPCREAALYRCEERYVIHSFLCWLVSQCAWLRQERE